MPFASRPSAPVEAPSNGTTSATGRRAQRNSRSGDRRVGDYYHPYGAHRARFAAPHHDRVAHRLCLDGPTSFAATFVLVMKLIRLGSHTGFAPLCGPVLLFAILGAMLGLVTLSPVDARSIRLAFGVCTAYAYIWGMLFFMIGLATAASCETAHELKCANWAFWWFAIAVIDWALASWLIWKRMREPSTVSAAQYPSHWHDVAGSAHIGLPAGATCVIISLVSNALYDPYLDGWRFGRGFILDAEEKDSTR